jgi:hypothetical protein
MNPFPWRASSSFVTTYNRPLYSNLCEPVACFSLPLYYFHVFVGTLKGRDVLRIVNNYNLIYNLHFPEDRVLEIAQQCTVPNTHEVVIDEFVKVLWELMKTV